ncbi:MAG: mycofactocin biosynthesis peptidyl-dipeptidase MftE [Acidimicrobiales bacterium]
MTALGDRTSPEIGDERPVLLVPLGSTEQHGPHLPIDTDTRIAVAICGLAAASLARTAETPTVRVAPAVAYGASGEHQGFAGTLSIGQDALERAVVELGRSAGDDYRLVVFVNGHGGNAEPLGRARATLGHERRPIVVWSPRLVDGDSHAGRTETSVLLALAPDVVHLDRAEPGVTTPLPELLDELRAGGLAAVTPNGVLGDPTGATAEEGRVIVDTWAGDLADVIVAELARLHR